VNPNHPLQRSQMTELRHVIGLVHKESFAGEEVHQTLSIVQHAKLASVNGMG